MRLVGIWFFILLFTSLIPTYNSRQDDYFTSPAAVQKLVKVEQQILSAFNEYASVLEKRVEKVKRYLDDYEQSVLAGIHSLGRVSQVTSKVTPTGNKIDLQDLIVKVSSHPLMTYRLIRRFVVELQDIERDLGSQNEKKVLNTMEKIRKGIELPTRRDVQGSIEGLLRIHDVYNLDINDFTGGNFQGLETKSSLTAADCYLVGMYALESQIHTRSIEWLRRAYRLTVLGHNQSISAQNILKDLEVAILSHDDTQQSDPTNIYVYRQPILHIENLKLDLDGEINLEKVSDNREYVLYKDQENLMDLFNFAALCSGKSLQTANQSKLLTCIYKPHPVVRILVEKVEILHQNPDVIQIYDVISETAMKRIIEQATPLMKRAKVIGTNADELHSTSRTSTTTWFNEDSDEILKKIPRRVQSITGLTVGQFSAEQLQVSSYGIGGHYNPHLDLLFEDFIPGPEDMFMGDRIATFMFYLSEVGKGGGTAFPRLGIVAKPVRGSAIFWFNLRTDLSKDPFSLHGGCPVLYGTKHVANKWIRANAQMQTRKCGLQKPYG